MIAVLYYRAGCEPHARRAELHMTFSRAFRRDDRILIILFLRLLSFDFGIIFRYFASAARLPINNVRHYFRIHYLLE